MRDGGCTWRGIIMDTNPPGEDGWWYKYFEIEQPSNGEIFKQPSVSQSKVLSSPQGFKDRI